MSFEDDFTGAVSGDKNNMLFMRGKILKPLLAGGLGLAVAQYSGVGLSTQTLQNAALIAGSVYSGEMLSEFVSPVEDILPDQVKPFVNVAVEAGFSGLSYSMISSFMVGGALVDPNVILEIGALDVGASFIKPYASGFLNSL